MSPARSPRTGFRHLDSETGAVAVTSKNQSRQFRIFIVDDHPLMREGLKASIESQPDLIVCGEADDVPEALENIKSAAPNLIIVDLALKYTNGLDLLKELKSRHSQVKLLVVSAYDEMLYAERAMRAGAHGYINKQEAQHKLIDGIREVLAGRRYLSEAMTQRMLAAAVVGRDNTDAGNPLACLTDREMQVFELFGHGKTTSAIAKQLHLSVHTIDSHRENIRHKLQLANGTELMHRAVQWVLEMG